MGMLKRTADFLSDLRHAQDIDAIWTGMSRFAAAYGMERIMLGASRFDADQRILVPVEYRTDLPAEAFRAYLESRRYLLDPMFKAVQMLDQPLCAHLDEYRSQRMTQERRDFFETDIIQAWPFRMAMPIVTAPDQSRWSVVFGGHHTPNEARDAAQEAASVLWLAASAAGLRLLDLARPSEATPNPLSPREQECLLRLAQGLRIDRIAERLGLSTVTVEMHLANARRKLRARTSPEAVARAVQNRFIDP
jgi:DNA-binding CsgD family transcriptional regulator